MDGACRNMVCWLLVSQRAPGHVCGRTRQAGTKEQLCQYRQNGKKQTFWGWGDAPVVFFPLHLHVFISSSAKFQDALQWKKRSTVPLTYLLSLFFAMCLHECSCTFPFLRIHLKTKLWKIRTMGLSSAWMRSTRYDKCFACDICLKRNKTKC